MARYDYRCKACGYEAEIEHGMSEEPFLTCPKCLCQLTRQVSTCSFRLKGRCWSSDRYTTHRPDGTTGVEK